MDQSYRNKVIGGGICLAAIGLAGLAYLKRDALLSAFLSQKSLSAGVQVQPESLDRNDQIHAETSEVACGASQPTTVDASTDSAVVARATVSVQTDTVRQQPPTEKRLPSLTLVNRACGRDAPFVSDVSTSTNQTTAVSIEVQTPEFIDALYKCESTGNTTTEDNHPHQPLPENKPPRCSTPADRVLEKSGKEQVDASDSQKIKSSISCEEFEEDDSGSVDTSEESEWCSSEENTLVQSISNERYVQTSQKCDDSADNESQARNYKMSGYLTELGQGLQASEANGKLPTHSLVSECFSSEKKPSSLLCKFKSTVDGISENATITFDTDSRPIVSEFIASGRSGWFVANENVFSKRVLKEIQQSLPQNGSKPCDKSVSLSYAPSGVAVQVEPGNVSDCESGWTTSSVSEYGSQQVRNSPTQNSMLMTQEQISDSFSYVPSAAQKLLKPERDESCASEWTGSSLSEYAGSSVNNSQEPPWNSFTAISDKIFTSETIQEAHELKEECAQAVGNDATTGSSLSDSFSLESYGRVQTCTPTIASNYRLKSADSETECDDSSSLSFHGFQGYGGSSTTVEKTTIGTNHATYKTTVGVDPRISMPVDSTAMATDDITTYETDSDEVTRSTSESFSLERNELVDQNRTTASAPFGCLSVSVDDLTSNRVGSCVNSPDCGDFASSRSYSMENDPEQQTSPLDFSNIYTEEFADTSASIAVVKKLPRVQTTSVKKVPNGPARSSSICGADNSNSFKSTEVASDTNKSTSVSDY